MFGHMKAQPILKVWIRYSVEAAVNILTDATEGAQAFRWMEFPAAALLFLTIAGDSVSGAFYVLDRRTGTWFWVDFEDEQYGGYRMIDFDLLVHEYDFLSLVERPGVLTVEAGWLLEARKPAEMAGNLGR